MIVHGSFFILLKSFSQLSFSKIAIMVLIFFVLAYLIRKRVLIAVYSVNKQRRLIGQESTKKSLYSL